MEQAGRQCMRQKKCPWRLAGREHGQDLSDMIGSELL